ncbi:hypothetical protein CCICO_06930 [Corynebacterium ciconiae DSM 44920]|uniref:hypothetical protein n=1 Tax=Corynebacterium ciconiae TaxID=227319 RepID=UPI00037071CA|nr:hypothetical protein [Corynebacterium ciconiae]WKD61406.1 hypothetical protein CCICO_06930 [Corynebacterium ciconiae DSM 44920]
MRQIVVIPSSPALIEGVSPNDEGSARLRAAAQAVLGECAAQARSIGVVCAASEECRTELTGSLSAWAPGAELACAQGGQLLGEIIARLLLGESEQKITGCAEEIATLVDADLVIVTADGPVTLTDRAPGGYHPDAEKAFGFLRAMLNGEDVHGWTTEDLLSVGVIDPQPWMDIFALRDQSSACQVCAHDTTGGVGRLVAKWEMVN